MKAPVEVQFAQKLAANEPQVRDKAVKKLRKWFGARVENFEDVEMMKIWKGLYYCFWMSDKPLVQEELAENISSFIPCFQSIESSLLFIKSFLKTFGREWFGIDKWRTNKFMMFVRRFLRQIFKFVASKDWETGLVNRVVDIFRRYLVLCPIAETSLDFQLHFTDVFLEELAKVGGEKLDPQILEILLDPYVELVRTGEEHRFRDHVVERIFNHLMRQSDPGIEWQMQEDGLDEEEMDEVDEGSDGTDNESDNEVDDVDLKDEEDNEIEMVEDPRAGGIDAIIPQMNVDYNKFSAKLFELGSADGVRKANRDALYKISKMFKDVANDVFPLGPNLSDEEIDIPKISVKKSAVELLKRNEDILRKNLEEKIKNKKLMSKMSKKAAKLEVSEDGDNANINGTDDTCSSSDEETSETVEKEKMSSKELRRKKKQEQKKRKREKELKIQQEKLEKDTKAQQMIEEDIDRKSTLELSNSANGVLQEKEAKSEEKVEKLKLLKKKQEKKDKALNNGVDVSNDNETLQELITMAENLQEKSFNDKSAIKKKKKKSSVGEDLVLETGGVESETKSNCTLSSVKKKKKKDKTDESSITLDTSQMKSSVQLDSVESLETSNSSASTVKKKKKNKDKALNSSSMSQDSSKISNPSTELISVESEATNTCLSVKKKKADKVDLNCTPNDIRDSIKLDEVQTELATASGTKKKKKLKRTAAEAELNGNISGKEDITKTEENGDEGNNKNDKTIGSELDAEENIMSVDKIDSVVKSSMKKKKRKKEMYRIDSDIAFNTPSLSQVNLAIEKENTTNVEKLKEVPEDDELQSTAATQEQEVSVKKKKKMKKYQAETSLLIINGEGVNANNDEVSKLSSLEESTTTPKSEKKKKKLNNRLKFESPETELKLKSPKVFAEDNSWGDALKPGETEIVIPNKKYTGTLKLSEPQETKVESDSLSGFESPIITPAKSFTSTFLKKALSKSVDTKKTKKEKKKLMEKCLSEPRKKRVNIVLTQNKSQDIPQHLKSVKNSPQTPHDPTKNPSKGVLKKRDSMETGNRLNPVQLNTQLNGRSKAAKVMVGKKRKNAMDFF